jgi:signal transduction histidine kinase
MKRFIPWVAACAVASLQWQAALAAELGTAKEAKAMLERAVAEMKKDSAAAIAKFNKGEDGFRDRDLYVFCATPDGITTAHPTNVGTNLKRLKDKNGKAFGAEIFKVARAGRIDRVSYMWPKPGSEKPVPKVTYVTRVANQVCGVGYYK